MPNTPNYAFPYPSLSDAPNVPGDMQALAEAMDTSLATSDGNIASLDGRVTTLENDTAYGAWIPMTLQNGWTPRVGYQAPGYRIAPGEQVQLVGTIIGGATTNGTVLFALAIGFRPDFDTFAPLVLNSGYTAAVAVRTSGNVEIFANPDTPAWTAATFTSSFCLTASS